MSVKPRVDRLRRVVDARGVIAVGVQTWGTDVAALRRYWAAADALGYARVTYGDGLWDWTHDGWTLLAALALETRRCRIGPAVTYAFDPAAHHPSWLAKRAVAIDHLSHGRLDLRIAVGAEAPGVAESWRRHGIAYPPARERLARLEVVIGAIRRLWAGESVTSPSLGLREARIAPLPVQRPGPPVWIPAMGSRALALVARAADGWEASFVTPAGFADIAARLDAALASAGRMRDSVRRSVEVDAAISESPADAAIAIERFCERRAVGRDHPVLAAALVGDADAVVARARAYGKAGATDLMVGFADFPATTMLERFAKRVLAALTARRLPREWRAP
jgi:alkanesulfonate monooxygenase SsuD/methylene tetrahydromethanopterin reductase-like flavin-dependent oxidoreductase (luciferase family)